MKKKRMNLCYKVIPIFVIALFSHSVSAFASNAVDVTNHGSIGAVDISLNCEMDGDTGAILPNQSVGLESFVTNLAEPAWLRMKIQYPIYQNETVLAHLAERNLTELNDERITFANKSWEKIGSYYYLKTPVESNETVAFTKSVLFPKDWDNSLISSKFGICVTAEAIQEKNFTPDFQSDDPWHGAVIEGYDSTDYMRKGEGNDRFSICYKGGAEGMVRTKDDFFSNWETLTPGDVVTGEATIENAMTLPVNLFFSVKSNSGDDVNGEYLLERLRLKIRHGDKIIYDGDLMDGMDEVLLKEYAPGESVTLSYELSVPNALDNGYAEKAFQTVWTFRAQEVRKNALPEIIKTGDEMTFIRRMVCVILIVFIGIEIHLRHGKRKREAYDEKKNV